MEKWKVSALRGQRWSSHAVRTSVAPSSLVVFVQGMWREALAEASRLVQCTISTELVTCRVGSKAHIEGTVSSPNLRVG
jgi:hypothetical protein